MLSISCGITVSEQQPAYSTIITIAEGYRGKYNGAVSIINSPSGTTYCGYYNESTGVISVNSSLPTGNYLIIGR